MLVFGQIFTLASLAAIPFLGLLSLHLAAFRCYTLAGVVSEYEVIVGLLALSSPIFVAILAIVGISSPRFYLVRQVRLALLADRLPYTLSATTVVLVTLVFAIFNLRLDDCTVTIRSHVENHNWIEAERELSALRQKPLDPRALRSIELFIRSAESAARYYAPSTNVLRQQKNSIQILLNRSPAYLRNILIEASVNNSLSIYYQEDDVEIINSSVDFLKKESKSAHSEIDIAIYNGKMGELKLAIREYEESKSYFEYATSILPPGPRRSAFLASNGNSYAALGQYDAAVKLYQAANESYPEGRRMIFFSNLGYISILSGDYDRAIEYTKRAIKIDETDWYSYLNLGIAYDEIGRHADAQLSYRLVIENETSNPDAVREALIFLGRSIEVGGGRESDAIMVYLLALGRESNDKIADEIIANNELHSRLYTAVADALLDVNTHGIERYMEWFSLKSKEF